MPRSKPTVEADTGDERCAGYKWRLVGFGAATVILSLRCLGFTICLWAYVLRFASRPGVAASLNLSHETVLPICSERWHSILRKSEYTSTSLLNPPNPLWGDNWSFWFLRCSGFPAVCFKQQQRTLGLTVLAAFTQASHTKHRQKSELTPVNVSHWNGML